MTGLTGLIFGVKARYQDYYQGSRLVNSEALFNEARTAFSAGVDTDNVGVDADPISDPFDTSSPSYASTTSSGMSTATVEALGDVTTNEFASMSFTIEKSNSNSVYQSGTQSRVLFRTCSRPKQPTV